MEIVLPKLTSYQQEVYDFLGDPFESGKIAILKSVRQCGKTFFCQAELLLMAIRHPKSISAIYEPTLNLSRNVYKSLVKALEPTGLIKIANSQLLEIELTNGSSILFRSTEQTSRGLVVTGLLVLDECAYLDDESIYSILPLVNAHNAPIIIASTPFTMEGYYYTMYLKGLEGDGRIRTFDWADNPEIGRFLTEEQKELYRQTMSRQKFTTEVLGQFLTGEGLLFAGLEQCLGDAGDNRVLYIGIDFATGSEGDYTVLVAVNGEGEMVALHRTNNQTPTQQVEWLVGLIRDLASRYTIRTILAEKNSIGSVYNDLLLNRLKPMGLNITDWTTTNKSKQDIVTNLQILLENGRIKILNNPVLLNELKRYQAEINPRTKTITYNGYKCNDDTVIATMLAFWAYNKSFGQFRLSFV